MATEGTRMSETPEMVERVARACAAARFGTIVDRIYWNQESDSWRQAHIDIALAAIEALCEPTEAMVDAAEVANEVWVGVVSSGGNCAPEAFDPVADRCLLFFVPQFGRFVHALDEFRQKKPGLLVVSVDWRKSWRAMLDAALKG
jgi:hypothetical protein